ncbi:MAG: capsular biosynthesis protein [Hyphomicrobiales bacterium]|nr:MAG: capsular biosynthesis protein [Hyphomicrobiales bacterium]
MAQTTDQKPAQPSPAIRAGEVTSDALAAGSAPFPALLPLNAPFPISSVNCASAKPGDVVPLMVAAIAARLAEGTDPARGEAIAARLRALHLFPFATPSQRAPQPLSALLTVSDDQSLIAVIADTTDSAELQCRIDIARAENPDSGIVVVGANDDGTLGAPVPNGISDNVTLVAEPVDPWSLVERVERLYVGDHAVGLLAVLTGRPVTTFRAPFYAGWGLTDDRADVPWSGTATPSAAQFADALLAGVCDYRSPFKDGPVDVFAAMDLYRFFLDRYRENDRQTFCVKVMFWNHAGIAAMTESPAGPTRFTNDFDEALRDAKAAGGQIIMWASRVRDDYIDACRREGVPFKRLEDGFLRSVGLGAALARGASAAFDSRGIYFDATAPSDLEYLLENADISEEDTARAARLREAVVAARLTKYNVGRHGTGVAFPEGKTGVLVTAQVSDDAGITKTLSSTIDCSGNENVNLQLLKAARARNPDAYIIFKPHPDVEAGLREGKVEEAVALQYADAIAADADIVGLITQCARLETISSLAGFEALIRGKHVTVHGMPFYAGWGLTEDLTTSPRRTRKRSVDELVYCALIAYTHAVDPVTMIPCPVEVLVDRLVAMRDDKRHAFFYSFGKFLSRASRTLGLDDIGEKSWKELLPWRKG